MARIVTSFEYSGVEYIDKRQQWNSLAELKAQTTTKFPNGYEVWCEKEKSKYVLSTTNADDISTYVWKKSEAVGGSFELELNEEYTTDYDISVNTNTVESYGSIYENLYKQFAGMFKDMQSIINKQQAKINELEARVFALEQGSGVKPPILEDGLIDYAGDTLIDYDGNSLGDYEYIPVEPPASIEGLIDYNGDVLVDYNGNTLGDYEYIPPIKESGLVDYNGDTLIDYDGNTLGDYDTSNVVYLKDYLGNTIVDYKDDYIIGR